MPIIHAEIMYDRQDGESVHSDLCPRDCDSKNMISQEWRKYLHDCLDEWIDKSRGTGGFWIGDPVFMTEEFKRSE